MSTDLSRERIGRPQWIAGFFLLMFVIQCAWLVAHENGAIVLPDELSRVHEGVAQWRGQGIAGTPSGLLASPDEIRMGGSEYDPDHSPTWYLIESLPLAVFRVAPGSPAWLWLTRTPYIFLGLLLGASLWYVSRRLYGNGGGYLALAFYCFSPAVIRASTMWFSPPNIAAAWGTFGAVFTAIAVSHTLYAPREVVLWNWRRILLLGVSLALAIGSQFNLVAIVPVLLVFMLYLAPTRRSAALAILAAAIGVAIALVWASYLLHPMLMLRGLRSAVLFRGTAAAMGIPGAYLQMGRELSAAGPVLVILAPLSVLVWAGWRKARYFGNTAPLVMVALFAGLRVLSPHPDGAVFGLLAAIFAFVFVAGIAADLLETKAREYAVAILIGAIGANSLWNLIRLAHDAHLGPL